MGEFTPITTQEQIEAVLKDRLERQSKKFESEKADLEKKYSGYMASDDVTKLKQSYEDQIKDLNTKVEAGASVQTELDSAKKQIEAQKLDSLRIKAALENGIPYEFADRLKGTTAEELTADAKLFAKSFTKPAGQHTQPAYNGESKDIDAVSARFYELNPKLKK